MKKGGFTLLELLVVIVVISILATIVIGGANYALRVAREKRVNLSCKTLQSAIHRYYTEYNEWPGDGRRPNSDGKVVYSGEDNKKIFGALRADNTEAPPRGNRDGIVFIDATAFFTRDGDDEAQKLSETTDSQPLVFVSRSGRWTNRNGQFLYYKVTINYEFQTVKVEATGFDDEGDD